MNPLQPKSYTKAFILFGLIIVLLVPYSITAQVWDSGYRSEKSLQRNNISNSHLIIGRSGIENDFLVIDSYNYSPPSSYVLSGYSYESIITINNECNYGYWGRFIINNWPGSTLASGGYIQADGDDIALTYEGDTEESVTAMVGSGGDTLILDYYNLPANSALSGHLYMGNATMSRDQWWIADADDVTYAADDNSLDITTNLTIQSDIYLPTEPDGEQVIVSKDGAYEVLVDETPQIIFRLYGSAGGAGYTASGSPSSIVSSTLVAN